MTHEEYPTERSIFLWPGDVPGSTAGLGFRPWLDPYPAKTDAPRGAVLVCPGGGYGGRAPHEGVTIARRFNRSGFHAFVVQYRVAPHRHPEPLMDVSRAIRIIRSRAAGWRVLPDHIAVCGFSAGAHLTGSLGVLWDRYRFEKEDPLHGISTRPDALILCYPVISAGEFGHQGSLQNLLGDSFTADPARRQELSLELQVNERTPPAFLWHTFEDGGVPVENSMLFAGALRRHKVPFELHVYPKGAHGLGLAPADKHVATWMPLCCEWLAGMGWRG